MSENEEKNPCWTNAFYGKTSKTQALGTDDPSLSQIDGKNERRICPDAFWGGWIDPLFWVVTDISEWRSKLFGGGNNIGYSKEVVKYKHYVHVHKIKEQKSNHILRHLIEFRFTIIFPEYFWCVFELWRSLL